jgi:hypothetical protein
MSRDLMIRQENGRDATQAGRAPGAKARHRRFGADAARWSSVRDAQQRIRR